MRETEFATIGGGATIQEAERTALDGLRKIVPYLNPADVEYIVLDEGSKGGFFGRGKMEARVEARLRPSEERVEADLPPSAEKLREFIQTVVDLMGVEAHVGASEADEWVRAEISGDDLGLLIGRHGATIDALQYVAAIVVNGARRERRQVIVDAEGYRDRRAAALTALADRTAQKVARDAAAITLKPMTRGRAQGHPPAPQGPLARGDGLGGQRTVPRRRRLSQTAVRLASRGHPPVKEGARTAEKKTVRGIPRAEWAEWEESTMRRVSSRGAVLLLVLALVLAVAALAGCGDSGDTASADSSAATTTVASDGRSADQIVKDSEAKMAAVSSASFTADFAMQMQGDTSKMTDPTAKALLSQGITFSAKGKSANDPTAADMTMSVGIAGQTLEFGMKAEGTKAWVEYQGAWYKVDSKNAKALGQQAETGAAPTEQLKSMGVDPSTWGTEYELAGTESLNGVDVYHVTATADPQKLADSLAKAAEDPNLTEKLGGSEQRPRPARPGTHG